jgi:hypothetical protein
VDFAQAARWKDVEDFQQVGGLVLEGVERISWHSDGITFAHLIGNPVHLELPFAFKNEIEFGLGVPVICVAGTNGKFGNANDYGDRLR